MHLVKVGPDGDTVAAFRNPGILQVWCWAERQASCWMATSKSTVLRYPSMCIFWVLPWPARVPVPGGTLA